MLVSVVTPAYKAERHIEECLRSVHAQDHRPMEHVVVDDGSPDNQVQIVERLQKELQRKDYRVRLVRLAKNGGAARALQTGITEAQGHVVSWLSADDLYVDASKTSEQVQILRRVHITYDDACLVGSTPSSAVLQRNRWTRLPQPKPLRELSSTAIAVALLFRNAINATSLSVRRSVLEEQVSFDPILGNVDADGDFLTRAACLGLQFSARKSAGAFYRVHAGQTSNSRSAMDLGKAVARIRLMEFLKDQGALDELLLKERSVAAACILNGFFASPTAVRWMRSHLRGAADPRLRSLGRLAGLALRVARSDHVEATELRRRLLVARGSPEFARFERVAMSSGLLRAG